MAVVPYVFVELRSECAGCGAPLEQRRLDLQVDCPKCERRQTWHPRMWTWLLEHAARAAELPAGETRSVVLEGGGAADGWVRERGGVAQGPFRVTLTVGRDELRCPKC